MNEYSIRVPNRRREVQSASGMARKLRHRAIPLTIQSRQGLLIKEIPQTSGVTHLNIPKRKILETSQLTLGLLRREMPPRSKRTLSLRVGERAQTNKLT
jgi:hypothetical protein